MITFAKTRFTQNKRGVFIGCFSLMVSYALPVSTSFAKLPAPSKISRAKLRPTPPNWYATKGGEYWWRPDGSLLSIVPMEPVNRAKLIFRKLYLLKPKKGATPHFFSKLTDDAPTNIPCDLTPDGKWLLTRDHLSCTKIYNVATGKPFQTEGGGTHGDNYWIDNGRQWLDFSVGLTGRLNRPAIVSIGSRKTRKVRDLLEPGNRPVNRLQTKRLAGRGNLLYALDVNGELPGVIERPEPIVTKFTVRTMRVGRLIYPLRQKTFRLPYRGQVMETTISPDCKRVVFTLRTIGRQKKEGLFTCFLNGRGMKLLGSVPTTATEGDNGLFQSLRWMPGNQGVSFLYQKQLWSVNLE